LIPCINELERERERERDITVKRKMLGRLEEQQPFSEQRPSDMCG
jgi:hypothetical protein